MKEKFRHIVNEWFHPFRNQGREAITLNPVVAGRTIVVLTAMLPSGQSLILYPDGTWEIEDYEGH